MSNRLEAGRLAKLTAMCLLENLCVHLDTEPAKDSFARLTTLGRQLGAPDHLVVREQAEAFHHAFAEALLGAYETAVGLRPHILGVAAAWDWGRFVEAAAQAKVDLGLTSSPTQQVLAHTEGASVLLLDPTGQRVECPLESDVELQDGVGGQPNRTGKLEKVLKTLPDGELLVLIRVGSDRVPAPTTIVRALRPAAEPVPPEQATAPKKPQAPPPAPESTVPRTTAPQPAPEASEEWDWGEVDPPKPPDPLPDPESADALRIVTIPMHIVQRLLEQGYLRVQQVKPTVHHRQGDPIIVAAGTQPQTRRVLALATLTVADNHWVLELLATLDDEPEELWEGQFVKADADLSKRARRAACRALVR